jgi:hypothetical protein
MQKIIVFLLFFFIASCCNTKNAVASKNTVATLQSNCPGNGTCTITSNPGKSLGINEDEYGNLRYVLNDDATKSVFVITYNRNVPKDVQDGTYREEIIFECDNSNKSTVIEGEALKNAKLLFGRFCYCKGQTGYYTINNGTLRISGDNHQRIFNLDFITSKTPQVLSSVKFIVKD